MNRLFEDIVYLLETDTIVHLTTKQKIKFGETVLLFRLIYLLLHVGCMNFPSLSRSNSYHIPKRTFSNF